MFGGYSYMNSDILSGPTTAFPGNDLPNTPMQTGNLWTTYDVTEQWTIGGGGNWLGHRYGDLAQQANIPGYVVWNAMASYRINDDFKIQVNLNNIFDKYYYDAAYYTSASENHVIPGPGRTVLLTNSVDF